MSERLAGGVQDYDVVVVGGGINGAGVARDAALRGYRVGLVDRGDWGGGTSSRTSKLVHGGIRYLEHGALRLVWEASQERRRLLRLAPHLVRPLPFVFPVYRGGRVGPLRLRAGMWLYDVLAAFRNVHAHRMLSARTAERWGAGLERAHLRAAARYWDASMDDARLVLANVRGAARAGAVALARVEVTEFVRDGERIAGARLHDLESGARATWRARLVVACAGPWTNALLAQAGSARQPVATTRGSHIVVRPIVAHAYTLEAGRDGRVFFVLPWAGGTLIGTTDVAVAEDPEGVEPSAAEIDYLLAEANRFFPAARLVRRDVIAAFAGLRPLLRSEGQASARSREHEIAEPVPGLLAVAGGKYTTYRAVAESVVDRVAARLGRRGACLTRSLELPGAAFPWSAAEHWTESGGFLRAAADLARATGVDSQLVRRWLSTYGGDAEAVAAIVVADRALAAPLCPHQAHTRAEVVHAVRSELALHLEDWFLRRSRMAFAACNGRDAIAAAADVFAGELGWDDERRRAECDAVAALLARVAGEDRAPGA